jgi:hypothetical protein
MVFIFIFLWGSVSLLLFLPCFFSIYRPYILSIPFNCLGTKQLGFTLVSHFSHLCFWSFFSFLFFYIVIILKKDNVNINSMRKIIEDFRIDVLIVKHIESIFKNFRIFWKDVENHGNGMNALKIYFLDFLFFLIYLKKKIKNWIMIWMMEFTISH